MPERVVPAKTIKTSFFCYSQNNSGGRFITNDRVSHFVIIEARNSDEADSIAESKGLYFDGSGDCACCGNRWYSAYGKGDETPVLYDSLDPYEYDDRFIKTGPHTIIHYYDGTIEYIKNGDRRPVPRTKCQHD